METIELQAVSREDLGEWLSNPITKLYFTEISKIVKERFLALGGGSTLNIQSMETTALQTASEIGFLNGLRACLNVELPEVEELEDGG